LLKNRDGFMPFAPSRKRSTSTLRMRLRAIHDVRLRVRPQAAKKASHIVHGTARPNVVRKTSEPLYHALISEFERLSGVPVVLNTNFNRNGLPLINTLSESSTFSALASIARQSEAT
jgi:carbamoyltransferase